MFIRRCETKELNLWFNVGIHFFGYAGITLHIVFGYYSHFPEAALLTNANAKHATSQGKKKESLVWNTKCGKDSLINMCLSISNNNIILKKYALI